MVVLVLVVMVVVAMAVDIVIRADPDRGLSKRSFSLVLPI